MDPFTTLVARGVPFPLANVDTDRIVPARFLRKPRSEGYGQYAFHDLRRRADGSDDPEFVLNRPEYRDARILVAGENFGCGSSREAAVWALAGLGLRAWIAPSFGEIFYNNSLKNGVLAVVLPAGAVHRLQALLAAQPRAELTIDLDTQTVRTPDGRNERFEIDPSRKACLLAGMDEIDLTLRHEAAIAAYEQHQQHETPWLAPPSG